jgi:hypothetical protein
MRHGMAAEEDEDDATKRRGGDKRADNQGSGSRCRAQAKGSRK